MIEIYSFKNRRPRKAIPCGTRVRVEHALRFDEYGNKYLAEVGTFDQYAYIQSFAASCDINEIVRRATPEQMAEFKKGVYMDTSTLPKTLADSYKVLIDAEHVYDSMPADAKAQYANYHAFLNSFGNLTGVQDFIKNFKAKADAPKTDAPKEEVTT